MSSKTFQVAHFEIVRNLKKISFWLAAIAVPIAMALYIAFVALIGATTNEQISANNNTSDLRLGLYDALGYVQQYSFINADEQEQTVTKIASREQGLQEITDNHLDVLYIIPDNFATEHRVEVHVKNGETSIFDNYSAPIKQLLSNEAANQVDAVNYAVIAQTINYQSVNYDQEDNHIIDPSETISRMAAPIAATVLFYLIIILFGNRLSTAMVEEKENRISELLLTSVKPGQLIAGKTISLIVLGVIQLVVLIVPVVLMLIIANNYHLLPTNFVIAPSLASILSSLLLLFCAFFLFASICVLIGVVSPTARDASSYAGILVFSVVIPFMFFGQMNANPVNVIGYVLTYFPLSTPAAMMLRSIFGNLPTWEYWLGLGEIALVSFLSLRLAAYIFRRNAISFTTKINLKKLLGKPRKAWKN